MNNPETLRIIDACYNRAVEGLRVAEDYVRFVLDDSHLTKQLKSLRHDLHAAISTLPNDKRLACRDTVGDVGTAISTAGEESRQDLQSVFFANIQRARQSLRSLEEFGKVLSSDFGRHFESLRYRLYTLEKAIATTCESVSQLTGVSLCVLSDGRENVEAFQQLVTQVLEAGAGMIQLRDKQLDDQTLLQRARLLVKLAKQLTLAPNAGEGQEQPSLKGRGNTLVIINDRADIAAAADADGVHLGQEDLSVKDARSLLGPRKLIGVSTHHIDQARQAVLDGADYLGAGPTFPSSTKEFTEFPGLEYLQQLAAEVRLPAFAIGGINAENLPQVLQNGMTRVAVSGNVVNAEDPGHVTGHLMKILQDHDSSSGKP